MQIRFRDIATRRGIIGALGAVALLAAGMAPEAARADEKVTVFAAASLTNAVTDIAAAWSKETGVEVVLSFAGSSALAKQIEQGAPADVFLSANVEWMTHLETGGHVKPDSVVELLANEVVLIGPKGAAPVAIAPGFDLAGLLGDGKLAMANTEAVPAGRYGKAALQSLGVWDSVAASVAQADNVRAALLLVSRGEAPLGIVYATDAKIDEGVDVLGTFPADSHPPVIYPAAVTAAADGEAAARFLAHLQSRAAAEVFRGYGFRVLHRADAG